MADAPKKKLIEVALPLEAINRESAREKSIRHGHPSTLHLWWARRPLAACRAVLFAQLVDDPSARPDEFPTEEAQAAERQRLFDLIERLVVWENSNDEVLLAEAHAEILKSCSGEPPVILDPFAGGGSIPLEAQRLGLEAHASDLNPVAVLINKALIEIPPKWAGQPPVFPGAAESRMGEWSRATGLAEDVRRYGQWMRDEAEKRIGHLYPKAKLADGSQTNVIAWIWARTVVCPNPACGATMPLMRSFWLSKKKDRPTSLQPRVQKGWVSFTPVTGGERPSPDGTVNRSGATCITCRSSVPLSYIRSEAQAGRMSAQLVSVVAEGSRQRVYLPADEGHLTAADVSLPTDVPDTELPERALGFRVQAYGMSRHADLFTNRQLTALTTLSDLVAEARCRIAEDAKASGTMSDPEEYADDVAILLSFVVSRQADYLSSLCTWASDTKNEGVMHVFGRQALPMVWDFAEVNIFSNSSGNWNFMVRGVCRVLERLRAEGHGEVRQADAASLDVGERVVATDPPYYDNIGYADLADYFYVWLRRSLRSFLPDLVPTMLTPKSEELVATPHRFGGDKDAAERHFEDGFVEVFSRVRRSGSSQAPVTLFYAFKQAEDDGSGVASTGWETLLTGLIRSGMAVTATWPLRTERQGRMVGNSTNALASSIVLACRTRSADAPRTDRKGFIAALRAELPGALVRLQEGSVAPVDLAQAAIGPGMAVFSGFERVSEADGTSMSVRMALALVNQVLAEVLSEQEGDVDADTRWCLKWFESYGFNEGHFGEAETLATAMNTSVSGLERAGVLRSAGGKARLLGFDELSDDYDPGSDARATVWEVVTHLSRRLEDRGVDAAGEFLARAGRYLNVEAAKELAYLLFSICEKKQWTESAIRFNSLVSAWPEIAHTARSAPSGKSATQGEMSFYEGDE